MHRLTLLFVFLLSQISCTSVENYFLNEKKEMKEVQINSPSNENINSKSLYDDKIIAKIIRQAKFDVYNRQIYKNPDAWIDKIISVSGIIVEKPPFELDAQYFQISGTIGNTPMGDHFNYIVEIDHSLPTQSRIDQNVQTIVKGGQYRIFARVKELKQFLNDYGQSTTLPVTDCLIIFKSDDFNFQFPIWVTKSAEVLPKGIVEVDSLKYEFPKSDSLENK